ncbi:heat shock 70 kDa protein 1A-like [Ptychodera flava]|uniref:heat shock 70 kDa protein 1A-like n=1 Tax=Ptychodera flava TaxID=63121 RepID=UPI00396AAEEC
MTTKRTSVGIDLGISKSCVSVFQNGKIETIANVWGKPTTASYVAFTDNGCVIGDPARDQMNGSQQNSLFNIKHLIGGNIGKSVEQNLLPYKIVEDDAGMKIQIEQKSVARTIHPEEILALTLGQLKELLNYIFIR